jgi:hypothetical protein
LNTLTSDSFFKYMIRIFQIIFYKWNFLKNYTIDSGPCFSFSSCSWDFQGQNRGTTLAHQFILYIHSWSPGE